MLPGGPMQLRRPAAPPQLRWMPRCSAQAASEAPKLDGCSTPDRSTLQVTCLANEQRLEPRLSRLQGKVSLGWPLAPLPLRDGSPHLLQVSGTQFTRGDSTRPTGSIRTTLASGRVSSRAHALIGHLPQHLASDLRSEHALHGTSTRQAPRLTMPPSSGLRLRGGAQPKEAPMTLDGLPQDMIFLIVLHLWQGCSWAALLSTNHYYHGFMQRLHLAIVVCPEMVSSAVCTRRVFFLAFRGSAPRRIHRRHEEKYNVQGIAPTSAGYLMHQPHDIYQWDGWVDTRATAFLTPRGLGIYSPSIAPSPDVHNASSAAAGCALVYRPPYSTRCEIRRMLLNGADAATPIWQNVHVRQQAHVRNFDQCLTSLAWTNYDMTGGPRVLIFEEDRQLLELLMAEGSYIAVYLRVKLVLGYAHESIQMDVYATIQARRRVWFASDGSMEIGVRLAEPHVSRIVLRVAQPETPGTDTRETRGRCLRQRGSGAPASTAPDGTPTASSGGPCAAESGSSDEPVLESNELTSAALLDGLDEPVLESNEPSALTAPPPEGMIVPTWGGEEPERLKGMARCLMGLRAATSAGARDFWLNAVAKLHGIEHPKRATRTVVKQACHLLLEGKMLFPLPKPTGGLSVADILSPGYMQAALSLVYLGAARQARRPPTLASPVTPSPRPTPLLPPPPPRYPERHVSPTVQLPLATNSQPDESAALDRVVYVAIEGSVGAGKSTCMRLLEERYRHDPTVKILHEPVDAWREAGLLQRFYSGSLTKLEFQLIAMTTLVAPIAAALRTPGVELVISERSLMSNRDVFASLNLKPDQMDALDVVYKSLDDALPALRAAHHLP